MGTQVVAVAVGGAVGCSLRYLAVVGVTRFAGTAFPWGTMLVNIVGCLLAGILFGLVQERAFFSPLIRLLLLTGFLGGFTTFSTFAVETVSLLRDGSWLVALSSVAVNNLVGIAFALAGIYLMRVV